MNETLNTSPSRFAVGVACVAIAALIGGCGEDRSTPRGLPALAADLSKTTVSGISSGAYMAGQFQLAHADIVTGAAIIAGGPYGCAQSALTGIVPAPGQVFFNASRAVSGCMLNALAMWGVPNAKRLADRARQLAEDGRIGPINEVVSDRVYLFTGRNDQIVRPGIVRAAAAFYRDLGVPEERIKLVDDFDAGHAFVTMDKGLSCSASKSPFVEDCDYDQAGALLTHLYPDIKPPVDRSSGLYVTFSQAPYVSGLNSAGMADEGMAYIPKSCAGEREGVGEDAAQGCRVHIAFHGCQQNLGAVGDTFIKDSGFARWADTNRLIVIYPQTRASALNPQGCWDWWGYTGSSYLTRDAEQIVAVARMLKALAASPGAS